MKIDKTLHGDLGLRMSFGRVWMEIWVRFKEYLKREGFCVIYCPYFTEIL